MNIISTDFRLSYYESPLLLRRWIFFRLRGFILTSGFSDTSVGLCCINILSLPQELPRMKLGTLAHTVFLLEGTGEEIGGFNTTISALLQLVGRDVLWDTEPKEETEEKKDAEVIN
jgi:hypothetical protein